MEDPLIKIGKITRPHGIGSGLRVMPLTQDLEHFLPGKSMFVALPDGEPRECIICQLKTVKNDLIVFLEGLSNRNDAEPYRGGYFLLPRSRLVPPEEGAYFVFDLEGLEVVTMAEEPVGTLTRVISSGPQDLYEITVPGRKNPCLVPACRQFVRKVDIAGGKVYIDPVEGLLEI